MDENERNSRFARQAIKAEEARRRILHHAPAAMTAEQVPLYAALGRRLAAAFAAPADVPHFRRSGLDGYAVRSADAADASAERPAELRAAGHAPAGGGQPPCVEPGTAVRVMTGAIVPDGADAVVMLEQTEACSAPDAGPAVRVKAAVRPGQNVAEPGTDFRLGEPLFAAGTRIGPGHVAAFAAFGAASVAVLRRPRVGIVPTGDELAPADAPRLGPGQVRNSNAPMLAAQAALCGAEPLVYAPVPDRPAALTAALQRAAAECDVVVTTGGVSVGDHDTAAELLRALKAASPAAGPYAAQTPGSNAASLSTAADLGAAAARYSPVTPESRLAAANSPLPAPIPGPGASPAAVLFDKVAMRPGSPTSAALLADGKLWLALSGNPGACFVGFELFVRPVIRKLLGEQPSAGFEEAWTAVMEHDYPKGAPHDRFERAVWRIRDGRLTVGVPVAGKSGMLRSIPDANALLIVPAGPHGLAEGERVRILPLGCGEWPSVSVVEPVTTDALDTDERGIRR